MINKGISSSSKCVTWNRLPWPNVEYAAGAGEGCLHVQSWYSLSIGELEFLVLSENSWREPHRVWSQGEMKMNRKSQICNLTHHRLETKLQSSKQSIDGIDLSTQKEVMLASFSERIIVFGQNKEYFSKPKILQVHDKLYEIKIT